MGAKSSLSPVFITCCFMLTIILFTTTPEGFSARKLEALPPFPNEGNLEAAKNQSKGEVRGSTSEHDGSAAGNSTPIGTVQLSPPTAVTKISYGTITAGSPPDYP